MIQNGGDIEVNVTEKNPEILPFEAAGFFPGSKVEIKVADINNDIKYTTSVIANDNGCIKGEISIGSWNNGTYVLHVKGRSKRDGHEQSMKTRFEHFKKHIWN